MTPDEREALIEQLAREADEGRRRIAEMEAARERDPAAYDDRLRAEHRELMARREADPAAVVSHAVSSHESWAEPMRSPDAQKSEPQGILYRDFHDNAQAASSAGDGGDLFAADPEFGEAIEKFAGAVERRLFELEKENDALRAENVEVKGLLGDALSRFAKLEGKVEALTALFAHKTKLWMP